MAMVLLVAEVQAGEPVLGPNVAERLAGLGITRITLLRDASSTAVVLEGWAFDPARSDLALRALFPAGGATLRTFHQVEQVGVSSSRHRRETRRHPTPNDPVSSFERAGPVQHPHPPGSEGG
jgi:hypothetical protein